MWISSLLNLSFHGLIIFRVSGLLPSFSHSLAISFILIMACKQQRGWGVVLVAVWGGCVWRINRARPFCAALLSGTKFFQPSYKPLETEAAAGGGRRPEGRGRAAAACSGWTPPRRGALMAARALIAAHLTSAAPRCCRARAVAGATPALSAAGRAGPWAEGRRRGGCLIRIYGWKHVTE